MYQFTPNKYLSKYNNLINSRAALKRSKRDGNAYERHHIIPRSLGGSNQKSNLVLLTPREHFVAHLLLIRIVQPTDIYRMVHAIVRFSAKVKNSREFGVLRSSLTRFSTGEHNHSYGRIWAHTPTTGEVQYVLAADFVGSGLVKGLPEQRGGTSKGDRKWINNGIIEDFARSTDEPPEGWMEGRLCGGDIDHMRRMTKARHTSDKDAAHAEKLRGRIVVRHPITKETKRISHEDVSAYKEKGFVVTTNPTSLSKQCQVHGVVYETIGQAAKATGCSKQVVTYRAKSTSPAWHDWILLP